MKRSGFKRSYKHKTDKQKLIIKCDRLWSKIIRKRDPLCRCCKKRPSEDAHHIIYRRKYWTRYELLNGLGLCKGCHKFKIHQEITVYVEWEKKLIGQHEWDRLHYLAYTTHSTKFDFEMAYIKLKEENKE
jgi:hypothetical protein